MGGNFCFVFLMLVSLSHSMNRIEPYFRNDYQFIARQDSFYKVLSTPLRFADALARCGAEGAQLAFPRSEAEAELFTSLMSEYLPKDAAEMWVGAHDRFAEGVYQTIDGEEISSLYANWDEGEPNDWHFNQDCLTTDRKARLNDVRCTSLRPALCRRPRAWTHKTNPTCETVDTAYVPDLEGGRCYKVHTEARNWSQAFAICNAEQAYLIEVNSQKEAEFLRHLLANYPQETIKGNFDKEWFSVGFNDLFYEGDYRTSHGKTLEVAGYEEWCSGQPDNYLNNENCGAMNRDIRLNDFDCDKRIMFICEKEIGDPHAVDLFSRFGDTFNGSVQQTL